MEKFEYKSRCWRCEGFGKIQSLEHSWWMFWKQQDCPYCEGTGTIKKEMTREDCLNYVLDKIEHLEKKNKAI